MRKGRMEIALQENTNVADIAQQFQRTQFHDLGSVAEYESQDHGGQQVTSISCRIRWWLWSWSGIRVDSHDDATQVVSGVPMGAGCSDCSGASPKRLRSAASVRAGGRPSNTNSPARSPSTR